MTESSGRYNRYWPIEGEGHFTTSERMSRSIDTLLPIPAMDIYIFYYLFVSRVSAYKICGPGFKKLLQLKSTINAISFVPVEDGRYII